MSLPLPLHEFGNPQAPTVMLLHPGGALHSVWLPLIRAWGSQYHIVAPDLIQRGSERVSLQDLANQIIMLIEHRYQRKVWLVGASLGANVALLITIYAPHLVAGLVLDSAQGGGNPPPLLPKMIRLLKRVAQVLPRSLITAFLLRQFSQYTPADQLAIRAELEANGKTGFLEQIEAHFEYDVRQSLSHISVPTLIIAGEHDMLTKSGEPHKLQSSIKSARLVVIPKAGHVTFLQQPAVFEQIVTQFLKEQISASQDAWGG